jgi:hypothetical protein
MVKEAARVHPLPTLPFLDQTSWLFGKQLRAFLFWDHSPGLTPTELVASNAKRIHDPFAVELVI